MDKKFILTDETKEMYRHTLHRIKALKDFGDVEKGELGGWAEKEENLSQEGDCWIYDDASVYDNARVCDNACVYGNARVYGDARFYGDASIFGYAQVFGNACIYGNAWIYSNALVFGDVRIYGDACVYGDALVNKRDDILWITGIGSRYGTATVCRGKDDRLIVSCGCFLGTLNEFVENVNKTHEDNKFGREYKALIELIKNHFDAEEKE